MNVYVVINWILFFGLVPISFYWLKRAYKIGIKKDYSFVALKGGIPPTNPQKYAIFSVIINLASGLVLAIVFLLVIIIALDNDVWTAIVGPTIWMKLFADYIVSRQAHMKEQRDEQKK